jgi:hypothetical protein
MEFGSESKVSQEKLNSFSYRYPGSEASSERIRAWKTSYKKWWEITYKKCVPKNWSKGVSEINQSLQCDPNLSDIQMEAAINYPEVMDFFVLTTRKLKAGQLALALSHPLRSEFEIYDDSSSESLLDSRISAQQELGVSLEEIDRAKETATKIIKERKPFYLK